MASARSLGISHPSAVPYLISEGILPTDPKSSEYSWQRFGGVSSRGGEVSDELVVTKSCVVWSRGAVIRRTFQFNIENEAVKLALFATFSPGSAVRADALSLDGLHQSSIAPSSKVTVPKVKCTTKNSYPYDHFPQGVSGAGRLNRDTDEHHQEAPDKDRALVVILKTQAHIFFLSGTSHILHLPFEVAAAFSTPYGLILERHVDQGKAVPLTPQYPLVPTNSFSLPQLDKFRGAPSSQASRATLGLPSHSNESSIVSSLLKSVSTQAVNESHERLPSHFCLQDPLTELTVVLAADKQAIDSFTGNSKAVAEDCLGIEEKIVYVSSKGELDGSQTGGDSARHLLLAVSINTLSGLYNIWKVGKRRSPASGTWKKRLSAVASGAVSRRRSSYGPMTGTTTPVIRTSMGPRESFGGLKDVIRDPALVRDDIDLASQLDPAFENPGAPVTSSRRISSLLARSELAMNRDSSAIVDFSSGHPHGLGARRGTSFFGSRSSLGNSAAHNHTSRGNLGSSYVGLDVPGIADRLVDAQSIGSESEDEIEQDRSRTYGILRDSQDEIIFTKIHTLQIPNFDRSFFLIDSRPWEPHVFTLCAPNSRSLGTRELVLCIVNKGRKSLSVVHLDVTLSTKNTNGHRRDRESDIKVTGCQTEEGVLDACKINDSITSRIVVLGTTEDGFGELTLQSPWSTSIPVILPPRLLVRHPYQVDHWKSVIQTHEGGINRVIRNRSAAMCALKHCFDMEQVEFEDSEGTLHRLEIQMSPRSAFVVKAILTCQAVLPPLESEREPILRAWWELKTWICRHYGEEVGSDWTTFVVVLFLMFAKFLDDQGTEHALKTNRKTKLLRSSCSAQVNLESFETMIWGDYCGIDNPPRWLQGSTWQWALEKDRLDTTEHVSGRGSSAVSSRPPSFLKKLSFLPDCLEIAKVFMKTESGNIALGENGYLPTSSSNSPADRLNSLPVLLLGLHLMGEELKLDILSSNDLYSLTPVLAQMGGWLDWEAWGWAPSSFYMLANINMDRWVFDGSRIGSVRLPRQKFAPPSILKQIEDIGAGARAGSFLTLPDILSAYSGTPSRPINLHMLTPRTLLALTLSALFDSTTSYCVMEMEKTGLTVLQLDTFPEGVAIPLRSALAKCQAKPGSTSNTSILAMIDRDDIAMLDQCEDTSRPQIKAPEVASHDATRDFHTVCNSTLEVEQVSSYDGSAELDRQTITRMIFKDDQRFGEAAKLLHPLKPAVARCFQEPDWSDTDLLEAQQEMVKVIAIRTLSFSPGRGMLFYSARFPLLTEKFPIHGFTLSCIMKPSNTTVTADRNVYTEEKVSWAFFHAGVEAGLSISKGAKGVDTSWILFNKPQELSNRHAGFLLALGLNGHLKSIAKWVAFKYLTPKHTMTSIGLLLGLAASYLGTMDTLITRLLSVHVTRMLPPGAAELNLSPLTQTAGIMAIGLLYCGTQHRRMSEIMLSEIENTEQEDSTSPMDDLRDEGYRLAAGLALGYINLGQGKNLTGLHDMQLVERLLVLAVATKRVDLVHILDKATAAATLAIALIFMKTEDAALARKIDVPDTAQQFEYVRPDIFLLRTLARHLIMWNGITPTINWMRSQLPKHYHSQVRLNDVRALHTGNLPLFNIIAGICISIGLRFAGTARQDVRDLLGHYLDQFIRISRLPALSYDNKLTRITTRNCQDTVALAAASVMAGTGDIYLFRRLRALHGRTDPETPFGSHLAAHQAIGLLFLGGGTYTFNTSNLAVASLLSAFYPLFPTTVQDNKSHLQAFRHLWVLASEPRCLTVRNVENLRPMTLPVVIVLQSGKELEANAPCLLPELESISSIFSNDPRFWRVTLDFAGNPGHLSAFKRHQSMFVRRRGAYDGSSSIFAATIQALNDSHIFRQASRQAFEWIFELGSFKNFDKADRLLVLPSETSTVLHNLSRVTTVDDKLCLTMECLESTKSERLWNLRALFAWADLVHKSNGEIGWIAKEIVEAMRAKITLVIRGETYET